MTTPAQKFAEWREHPSQMVRELFHVQPDAWQEEALEAFPHERRLAMKAPICLDEMVPTPRGVRKWGSVKRGEGLFADDGSITKVSRRVDVGVVPIFRVRFRDGTSIRVSGDHEWDVQTPYDRKISARRTVSTLDLLGMKLRNGANQRLVSVPAQAPCEFPRAEIPADPYIFGLWLGDGVANEPRLICPDRGIRDAIRARGQAIGLSSARPMRVGLHGWGPSLRATGLSGCRSFEKYIPHKYKIASVEQRLDLLRGLMDSDGTVAKNGHCYLASCSVALIEDFLWLARSLGYLATRIGPYKINDGENRDSYRAVICGQICPFLADTSKKRRWKKPIRGKYQRFIESIVPEGEAAAMCVEVEHQSHCFQATDFIVTHNCKGPGKTAVLAWLGWNFMLTRPFPIVGVTSISGDNLKANLWTELARWRNRAPLLTRLFEQTKTEIFSREHPQTWRMEARTWAKDADAQQIGNALAGLHAKYIMWLLDESGDYPNAIMPTCEGIFNGEPVEAHIVQAGNPTRLDGPLYRAATVARKLWRMVEITADPDDPKRTPRVSVETAREQIEQYGRDNPWVLVNIFGQFPPASFNALIGPDEVSAAMKRYYRPFEIGKASKILGVDVARFGDDGSVIARREGIQMYPLEKRRNIDSTQGAGWVNQVWNSFEADAAFIDATGGHGAGWVDQLRNLGKAPIGVQFAGEPHQKVRYFNKRTEMAFDLVQWIKDGGALPESPELLAALTKTTYTFKGDKLLLAPKDIIKAELGYSPDEMDAAMLTFAEPVVAHTKARPRQMATVYDPFKELDRPTRESYDTSRGYDPFR